MIAHSYRTASYRIDLPFLSFGFIARFPRTLRRTATVVNAVQCIITCGCCVSADTYWDRPTVPIGWRNTAALANMNQLVERSNRICFAVVFFYLFLSLAHRPFSYVDLRPQMAVLYRCGKEYRKHKAIRSMSGCWKQTAEWLKNGDRRVSLGTF